MATELFASLLIVCGFLISVSAIQRYASNFIIPGVTIMMFIGAISAIVPVYGSDFKSVYDSIVDKAPDLILLIIIPLLMFESARKLRLEEIRRQIIPIGFFAIIGVVLTIFLIGIGVRYYFQSPDYRCIVIWVDCGCHRCSSCGLLFLRDFRFLKD